MEFRQGFDVGANRPTGQDAPTLQVVETVKTDSSKRQAQGDEAAQSWNASQMASQACSEAGVSGKVGWDTFRRTLASLFIAEGVDIKTVQESLRYSTSKITLDLYAQATTPNKLAPLRKLNDTIVPKTRQPTVLTGLNSETKTRYCSFLFPRLRGWMLVSC